MKNKIILIVSVAVIGLLTYQYVKIRKLSNLNQIQSVQLMSANDSVKAYRNKAGEAYFKLSSAIIDREALKGTIEAIGIENKALKSKEINWRNIVSILREQLIVSGRDTIWLHDTITTTPVKVFDWTNKHLSLSGMINNNQMDVKYSYHSDITSITEKRGNKSIVTVYLSDPNARILTGSQIIVNTNRKWWDRPWIYGVVGVGVGLWAK